jgi:peptidoglycan hydrolase CwlO-like protein
MKLRSTTPASISLKSRVVLLVTMMIIALAAPIQLGSKVFADKYDDQINALQQQVNAYQSQTSVLAGQAATLQSAVAQIQSDMSAIQAQINLSQVKYNQLTIQIAETAQKIKDNQDALGQTLADLYVDDSISPLEMIAGSKNISEYLDKQTYRSSIKDQLTSTITTIKDLKTKLDTQKVDVKGVLDQQTTQKSALAAKQSEQQDLLTQTQGQEASYQQLINDNKAKIAAAAAAQAAAVASYGSKGNANLGIGGGGGYIGPSPLGSFGYRNLTQNQSCPSGGYPYCGSLDSYADPYALYNRECVSYTAWAADKLYGKYVTSFSGYGMAYQFGNTAKVLMGATVDNTPEIGSVAILPPLAGFAQVGHAMVVIGTPTADGWVHVSQYNFGSTGMYSEMDVKVTGVVYVHFKNRF